MYSEAWLGSCLWVSEQEVALARARKRFTVRPRYQELPPLPIYREANGLFGFPRNSGVTASTLHDVTTTGEEFPFDFTGELWPNQDPVVDAFIANINRGVRDQILVADAGSGKTIMLLAMMCILRRPALVIVPKSDLIEGKTGWMAKIKQVTDIPESYIGFARQKRCDFEGKAIVLGMLQSLWKDKYSDDFKQYFGLVVFDELHTLGAFHFSRAISLFPARYRLGATATLSRSDGCEQVFLSHLGNEILQLEQSDQPEPLVAIHNFSRSSGRIPRWAKTATQQRACLMRALAKNRTRDSVVAYFADMLMQSGRRTLVLSERIKQLESIRGILITEYRWKPADLGLYLGRTSDDRRDEIVSDCVGILATKNMLELGTDIPDLKGLVFATPLARPVQAIGRICRKCPGTKQPFVVDIVDTAYSDAKRWAASRRRLYAKKKWEVHHVRS